jgi:hypothetical protein
MPQALLPAGKKIMFRRKQEQMYQDQSILINFRIDQAVKNQFHRTCRSAQSNMTVELNRMIRQFVADHKQPTIFERPIKWLTGDKASKP